MVDFLLGSRRVVLPDRMFSDRPVAFMDIWQLWVRLSTSQSVNRELILLICRFHLQVSPGWYWFSEVRVLDQSCTWAVRVAECQV